MELNGTFDIALRFIIAFIVLFNPFALYIYLQPVKKDLSPSAYNQILLRASLISYLIFLFFTLSGTFVFENILRINFESFRVFGGIVIFTLSYLYVVGGRQSIIRIHEDIDDMASEIAIPFFVGAATISLAILMGRAIDNPVISNMSLVIVILINYFIITALGRIHDLLENKLKVAFDKLMGVFLRLTGIFIGSLGVDMTITGIKTIFF